jgi:hypothetical protein
MRRFMFREKFQYKNGVRVTGARDGGYYLCGKVLNYFALALVARPNF